MQFMISSLNISVLTYYYWHAEALFRAPTCGPCLNWQKLQRLVTWTYYFWIFTNINVNICIHVLYTCMYTNIHKYFTNTPMWGCKAAASVQILLFPPISGQNWSTKIICLLYQTEASAATLCKNKKVQIKERLAWCSLRFCSH